jgi:hypothetical protein
MYGSVYGMGDNIQAYLRLSTSTPLTVPANQTVAPMTAPIQNREPVIDPDCCALCLVITGECAGTTLGCPDVGTFLGVMGGLLYETLSYVSDNETHE